LTLRRESGRLGAAMGTEPDKAAALRELEALVEGRVLRGEPLARHTTWGCGGAAELLIVPTGEGDLVRALDFCQARGLRWRVMGNGSNLLVNDAGVSGVVFKVAGALSELRFEGERAVVGAGLALGRLVAAAAGEGLGGLEWLAGIPGAVGGALAMNAGAHGHAIGGLVRRVRLWEAGAGVREVGQGEMLFGYRDSLLRRGGRVALAAELALERADPAAIEARIKELVERRRATQPAGRSAGSVFRNPPGKFAGALLEQAGLKGERIGEAEVSARHANFILNRGRATAADIRALIDLARARVREASGVELHPEVDIWED